MSPTPQTHLILDMRHAMAAVHRAARSGDKQTALGAINEYRQAAKRFFADDPPSLVDFAERLQEIRDALEAADHDEASRVAQSVWRQLEQLALAMAASGQLPELLVQLKALAAGMTPFDHYVGRLCQQTFRDCGSPERTLMWGMLHIMEYALTGTLAEGQTAASLLEGAAAKGGDLEVRVRAAEQLMKRMWDAKIYHTLLTVASVKREDGKAEAADHRHFDRLGRLNIAAFSSMLTPVRRRRCLPRHGGRSHRIVLRQSSSLMRTTC